MFTNVHFNQKELKLIKVSIKILDRMYDDIHAIRNKEVKVIYVVKVLMYISTQIPFMCKNKKFCYTTVAKFEQIDRDVNKLGTDEEIMLYNLAKKKLMCALHTYH